jgi:hypothetical protein
MIMLFAAARGRHHHTAAGVVRTVIHGGRFAGAAAAFALGERGFVS